jgi:hypothetical protein
MKGAIVEGILESCPSFAVAVVVWIEGYLFSVGAESVLDRATFCEAVSRAGGLSRTYHVGRSPSRTTSAALYHVGRALSRTTSVALCHAGRALPRRSHSTTSVMLYHVGRTSLFSPPLQHFFFDRGRR